MGDLLHQQQNDIWCWKFLLFKWPRAIIYVVKEKVRFLFVQQVQRNMLSRIRLC